MGTIVYLIDCSIFELSGSLYSRCYRICPEDRRCKIDRYSEAKDKQLSLAVYMLFAFGIYDIYGSRFVPEICIHKGGKPYIGVNGICFNFSHSGSCSACGFSELDIGVDIEQGKEDMSQREIRCNGCMEAYGKQSADGYAERLDEEDFAHVLWDGWHDCIGKNIFSKAVGNYILSVCTVNKDISIIKIDETHMHDYLAKVGDSIR